LRKSGIDAEEDLMPDLPLTESRTFSAGVVYLRYQRIR
jgi:hypothetical protein